MTFGVYRCPRCGQIRTMTRLVYGRVEIDLRRQRVVCPNEGADMLPLSEPDLAARQACASEGHRVEAWRGSCECGSVRA